MAATSFPVAHPLAQQVWAKKLAVEALQACKASLFIGKDADSLVHERDELTKSAGSKVTFGLRSQLVGPGRSGLEVLEGNEEAQTHSTDALSIELLRHAVKAQGAMSQQRVPFEMRADAHSGLRDWWADRFDVSLLNQLAGNSFVSDVKYTGMNAATAPQADHMILAGGAANEAALGTNAFTLDLLTKARVRAETATLPIRPIKIGGMEVYVAFLHPYQVLSIKTNTNTAQWLDIQKAAMTGGQITKNPIFTGALGMFDGVVIHGDIRVPWGDTTQRGNRSFSALGAPAAGTTNIARAVLCGAQAAMIAFGRETPGAGRMKWTEKNTDYDNEIGVAASLIWGVKKTVYTPYPSGSAVDNAVITMSSYAVAA